jgi:hypothetical protein
VVEADLQDQTLESRPVVGAGPGSAQILVDHQHPVGCPAQGLRAVDQPVLQARGLLMV